MLHQVRRELHADGEADRGDEKPEETAAEKQKCDSDEKANDQRRRFVCHRERSERSHKLSHAFRKMKRNEIM
jgi:hypothetical protein